MEKKVAIALIRKKQTFLLDFESRLSMQKTPLFDIFAISSTFFFHKQQKENRVTMNANAEGSNELLSRLYKIFT